MKLEYSNGNLKYTRKDGSKRKDTDHRVMIINQGTATECPSRKLGLCQLSDKKNCYAYQDEQRYPDCFPFRRRQEQQWKERSLLMPEMICAVQDRRRKKFTHLRFAEASDFVKQWDIIWLSLIVKHIKEHASMETFVYTARKDLIDKRTLSMIENSPLVVNGAGFMAHNEYRIVPEGYKPKHKKEIWCPDKCYICKLCKVRGGFTILAKERTAQTKADKRRQQTIDQNK